MVVELKQFHLENLDCAHCAASIQAGLEKLAGVSYVNLNFATATLDLEAEDVQTALQLVRNIEPKLRIVGGEIEEDGEKFEMRKDYWLIAAATLLWILGMIFQPTLHETPLRVGEYLVFMTAYLLSGWNVLANAGRNIWRWNLFDETFLMSIATLGAIMIHELPEAVGVMLFFKVGEILQDISVQRSRRSIKTLLSLQSKFANLKTGNDIRKVPPETVQVGAEIVVRPGEKIPLDGVVIAGNSQVDPSSLTGESVPKVVANGDEVFAGMVNKMGALTLQVTKRFDDSAMSKLLEMVQNANSRKARTEKFITKFAKYYTPVIVVLAAGVAILPPLLIPGESLSAWTYRAMVLLVIACPCALMVSIPLGYFGGVGGAARRGILVKGANFLDVLAGVKTVVFDKTGTLTKGNFKVTEVVPKNGYSKNEIMRIANAAEQQSNHPIAHAIKAAYQGESNIEQMQSFVEIPGFGVLARLNGQMVVVGNDALLHQEDIPHDSYEVEGTALHVALNKQYAGYIVVSDELKEDAAEAVQKLHSVGVREVVMLTGDRESIASRVANTVGVDVYHSEMLPEDKVSLLESILEQQKKGKVAFVGDGINDAPVIARADVGMAMGKLGTDAAIETADVVLMTDAPSKVAEGIAHAKRTRKIVWQNIGLAFGVKAIFISLGIMGAAGMWEAVFADVGVTVMAVLNATRVLK